LTLGAIYRKKAAAAGELNLNRRCGSALTVEVGALLRQDIPKTGNACKALHTTQTEDLS